MLNSDPGYLKSMADIETGWDEVRRKAYIANRLFNNDVMGPLYQQENHRWEMLSLPLDFHTHGRAPNLRTYYPLFPCEDGFDD